MSADDIDNSAADPVLGAAPDLEPPPGTVTPPEPDDAQAGTEQPPVDPAPPAPEVEAITARTNMPMPFAAPEVVEEAPPAPRPVTDTLKSFVPLMTAGHAVTRLVWDNPQRIVSMGRRNGQLTFIIGVPETPGLTVGELMITPDDLDADDWHLVAG